MLFFAYTYMQKMMFCLQNPFLIKMDTLLTGSFQMNGRSSNLVKVDEFEQRNSHLFGKSMGLSSTQKYIMLRALSPNHLTCLVHCELTLGRVVIYIGKIGDVSNVFKETGLSVSSDNLSDTLFVIECHHVLLERIQRVIFNKFAIIVQNAEDVCEASDKTRRVFSELVAQAERVVFNTRLDWSIEDMAAHMDLTKSQVKIRKLLDHLVPFRSFDIYKRVKTFLETHNSIWVKRKEILNKVIKEGEKNETCCFRLYDIPTEKVAGVYEKNVIYMKKLRHCIYFKMLL